MKKIPFRKGQLISRIDSYAAGMADERRDKFEFDATLTVTGVSNLGGLKFQDKSGHFWPILLEDLPDVFQHVKNGRVKGTFAFKQTNNIISIAPVKYK